VGVPRRAAAVTLTIYLLAWAGLAALIGYRLAASL
jgi:hypothetical protein